MIDPIRYPTTADRITLDNKEIPLFAELTSGGERKVTVEQQQSPGFAGYRTVVKGSPPPTLVYRFHLWLTEHFVAFEPWLEMLETAMEKRRPPRVFQIQDSAIAHNRIKQVICSGISPRVKVAQGHYAYDITFDEYKKSRPIGGVAVPKIDAQDVQIVGLDISNAALRAQRDAQKQDRERAKAAGEPGI